MRYQQPEVLPNHRRIIRNREVIERYSREDYVTLFKQYHGQLGAIYTEEGTEFKLWAPTASQVELLIYESNYGPLVESYVMEKSETEALWSYYLPGNQHGLTYRYRLIFVGGMVNTSVDPYSKAVTVNGARSVVLNLEKTNPEGWGERMAPFEDQSQAIIYEAHVRDFTVSNSSSIINKGKFLGVIEEGAVNDYGSPAGLDYLKELGVTHVEFLPMFDFQTVDETVYKPTQYNWGYDPLNYNAPEGSYATDAYNPEVRIRELKAMIKKLHDAGIRVIMDVVYNHVYEVEQHSLHLTVPGYFFRYNEEGEFTNGTGVGNDTASERPMFRKYIVDSVTYWAEEFHIDGFRFDLMGIHDIVTMNEVRKSLDEIDPTIMLFGEGWNLYTPLAEHEVANQNNAHVMPRIGQFNDGIREALKGNDFDPQARGFINGAWYMEQSLISNFMAALDLRSYIEPTQLIQYVEAHDNYTLYDRLKAADPGLDEETIVKRHELASTIILLAQGIPFIHAGQEFLRSKQGVRDSYNSPDHINEIDWNRQETYRHSVNLVKNLIQLRKQEPLLHLSSYEDIRQVMDVKNNAFQLVVLTYRSEDYNLLIAFNARESAAPVHLEEGRHIYKLYDGQVYLDDEHEVEDSHTIYVPPYTGMVLKQFTH